MSKNDSANVPESSYRELLHKLVSEGTLSVPERNALLKIGKSPIPKADVIEAVTEILDRHGIFPLAAAESKGAIYEGHILRKQGDGLALLSRQRSHPLMPWVLADSQETGLAPIKTAVERFVKLEWSRGIDGIAIR